MKTTTDFEVVEGIVINVQAYQENDQIITVYTDQFGKISFIGKGVKKILNKNASSCMLFANSEFTLVLKKGLSRLIKAQNAKFYRYIHSDIEVHSYGAYILEFFYRFQETNAPSQRLYGILKQSLEALNNGYDPRLVYLLFNTFILEFLGSGIEVNGCHICHNPQVAGISYEGGFVCKEHLDARAQKYPPRFLKAFRMICTRTISQIDQIVIDQQDYLELIKIIDYYIEEYTGMVFKSKKFINEFL